MSRPLPTIALAIAATGISSVAFALRPEPGAGYDDDAELASYDGDLVRVWYVTGSVDAPPSADVDPADGVPDFVSRVAAIAEASLERFAELGFRPPIADADHLPATEAGGDRRLDIYLVDLANSDGSFEVDGCVAGSRACFGHALVENDFAGFNYPTPELGIKTVVSHELFHAVQNAYDSEQDARWTEGTAVWAEELVFPEQGDFERLIAAFLAKPGRPFDRPTGSAFGDPYPYGAALFPTFLAERYGVDRIRSIWEASAALEGRAADFLSVLDDQLESEGDSLAAAFEEFTRWNLFTGRRADPDRGYADAGGWAEVAIEAPVDPRDLSSLETEGLSARYVALDLGSIGEPTELVLRETIGPLPRATLYADGVDGLGPEIAFELRESGAISARLDEVAPAAILLLSGVDPGSPMRTVTVETAAPAAGCQAAGGHSTALLFVLVFLFIGQSLRLSGRGLRSRADRRAYSIAVVIAVPGALLSFLLTTS